MDRDWIEQQARELLGPDGCPGLDEDRFAELLAAIHHEPKDPAGVVRVAYDVGLGHQDPTSGQGQSPS